MTRRSSRESQFAVLVGVAIGLLLTASLIRLLQAPDDLGQHTVRGLAFLISGLVGLVAAYGVYRREKIWGWGLGLMVTGGSLAFFVVSRVTGFPRYPLRAWTEPIEILAFIVEIGFVIVTMRIFQPRETLE